MRLDKFLAHAQIGTRSEVKKLVRKKTRNLQWCGHSKKRSGDRRRS